MTEIRKFSLGLGAILAALAGLQAWRGHPAAAVLAAVLAVLSPALGLAAPRLMLPVHALFLRVGAVLGEVNTRLILALIFYLVFTPAALVMKVLGRDPLARRLRRETGSYWITRPPETRGRERYEQMF